MNKRLGKFLKALLVSLLAVFLVTGCGEQKPKEKVYIEESEIDDALSNGDNYKGKWIVIVGKVFNVDVDGDSIGLQAYYDIENSEQDFIVHVDKSVADSVKEDDFIKVDGEITGTFTGENYFGGEITCMTINAEKMDVGGYDDIYAPAEVTKDVNKTKKQHGLSVTLKRVEFAKGEARAYIKVKNKSGYKASVYTYDAKAIQDGKQYEQEDNYQAGDSQEIGELLNGASKEGIMRFKGLNPDKSFKIQIEAFSDNYDITLKDYVFKVK